MKRVLALVMSVSLLTLTLAIPVASCTGCVAGISTQAKVYDSFRTTWNLSYNAYRSHCELVVQGKVSKFRETQVDAEWNTFRSGFKLALTAASQDWNAATPEAVRALSDRLILIIRGL